MGRAVNSNLAITHVIDADNVYREDVLRKLRLYRSKFLSVDGNIQFLPDIRYYTHCACRMTASKCFEGVGRPYRGIPSEILLCFSEKCRKALEERWRS